MRLMLLRHAKAEKAEPGMRDHARRSTARGRSDAALIGAYMARHALDPGPRAGVDRAAHARDLGAPRRRLAAPVAGVIYEDRLYNAGAEAILAVVKETGPAVRTLLVIGHNPGLHDLARLLIASGDVEARERLNEGLPTVGPRGDRFRRRRLAQAACRTAGGSSVS